MKLLALLVVALSPTCLPSAQDWGEILGPVQAEWPEPARAVRWRDDLRASLGEARETNRPLFVTVRCLPCKQCAAFDKDVLEGGEELDPLLRRFVTVRLTRADDLDLALLPAEGFQDLDLSWWGYLLSPTGQVYGIFGGRDEVSDTTRISRAALVATLERVLDHHYDPRRPAWDLDGPAPDLDARPKGPTDLPGFEAWSEWNTYFAQQSCVHCHQVAEILRHPALEAETFDRERDVFVWPYPENVGLSVDRDDGLLVTQVDPDGPAARAGVRVGDRLGAAAGRRLFGQADLRGVLHRGADPSGELELVWLRGDEVVTGTLELAEGWRETALDWRMSISQGNVGPSLGFGFPLRGPRDTVPAGSMSVTPYFGKDADRSPAYRAGLRPHHVIVAVDGESPDLAGRHFLTWFKLTRNVGDTVALTVLDGTARREIEYRLER